MDYSRPLLADRLAAEYGAGTLRGPARRRFEALLPAHAALQHAVAAWNARLAPLTQPILPVEPPPSVWRRIEARIRATSQAAAVPTPWLQRLAFWRGWSALATIATLGLGLLIATPDAARPPIVVVLNASAPAGAASAPVQPATFVASISADGRAMVTQPLFDVALQPDRALELWAVPASGAPRSLGVISPNAATVVRKGRVLDDTSALAVTLEPPGGSPSGAPTGPILYSGKLVL